MHSEFRRSFGGLKWQDQPRKKRAKRRTVLGTTLRAAGGLVAIAAVGGGARLWQTGAGGGLSAGSGFGGTQVVFGFQLGSAQTEAPLSPKRSVDQVLDG